MGFLMNVASRIPAKQCVCHVNISYEITRARLKPQEFYCTAIFPSIRFIGRYGPTDPKYRDCSYNSSLRKVTFSISTNWKAPLFLKFSRQAWGYKNKKISKLKTGIRKKNRFKNLNRTYDFGSHSLNSFWLVFIQKCVQISIFFFTRTIHD